MAKLRELILEGSYPAGARIPEGQLCEVFKVSRTPLREALKVLAAEGLLELSPNRSARVVSISLHELRDLFGLMSVMNGYAGELAVRQATDDDLATMRALQSNMRRAFDARDRIAYATLNGAFHDVVFRAACNAALTATQATIARRITISRYQANFSVERWTRALAEHDAVLQLLALRRGSELNLLLRSHIMSKFDSIVAVGNQVDGQRTGGDDK